MHDSSDQSTLDLASNTIQNRAADESQNCGVQPLSARSGGNLLAGITSASRSGMGAPPSNTAPANCMTDDDYPVQVLRYGIDSLYLSYPGNLNFAQSQALEILKQQARAESGVDQAQAVFPLPGHLFQVHAKGAGRYSYVLSDNAFRISLSGFGAKQLPLAYVQIKSDWLILRSVLGAVAELDVLVEQFGSVDDLAIESKVSRADLFVDFVCDFPFESVPVSQWITRVKNIDSYTVDRAFTGFSFGRGGDLSGRLYDKTTEIERSNKNHLRTLWANEGWDGESTVWRLEFQLMRPVLKEHDAGSVPLLLNKLGALWRYVTTSWLKLCMPSETDSTQSRWPVHPIWRALAAVDWQQPDQPKSIPVRSETPPSNYMLFINGLSSMTSFMARENIVDPAEAFERFYTAAEYFHNHETDYNGKSFRDYLTEKAACKARKWNLPYQGTGTDAQERILAVKAEHYRRVKDGE